MTRGKMVFGAKPKSIDLLIFPDSTNAPTFKSTGGVKSVARSAAGKFLVTLQDPYRKLRGVHATYNTAADNVDLYAQGGVVSNEGTTSPVTVVVKLKTGATNTDAAAADPDNFISVMIDFEDSAAYGT